MRDITLGETITFGFTTRAFATGVPTSLLGTPVLSVKEGANDTPITAGVSLDVDTCATPVTGLNEGTIIATSGNGYEAGKSYFAYISTGTVGGVSVVGEIVEQFTVQASAAFTRLGPPAGASVSADIAAIEAQTDDIGTAGAGLTALGDVRIANLDVASSTLATAANLTTVLSRLGSITGTGVNTVLGFFKALLSKSATLPTDIGGTFDPAADSTEAIRDGHVSDILTGVADGTLTIQDSLKLSNAANSGKTAGPTPGDAGTVTLLNPAGTKTRVSTSVDTSGYRTTNPTLDLS